MGASVKKENWDTLLAEFIESRRQTPFQWGIHDCTLFAVDAALAMTGFDLAAEYRGTYDSEIGAVRIIAKAGGTLRALVNHHGQEIPARMAQRGDWVLIEQDGYEALAVCVGVKLIAAGRNGLVQHPMSIAITAWRIN